MHKLIKTMMALLKLKKVSTLIIIVTMSLSVTIGAVTIYASQVGNFIVSVEPTPNLRLVLSETSDMKDNTGRLTATGINNMTNITYSDINIDEVVEGSGNTNDKNRYLAYNFYMQNQSNMVVNYKIAIEINKVNKNVDSAVRVMVITDKKDTAIYAKPQEQGEFIGMPETVPIMTTSFKSPTKVMDELVTSFRHLQIVKYTVVMWLEGQDAECTDAILSGSIRMSMRFTAIQ